jgi:hypothetical protein
MAEMQGEMGGIVVFGTLEKRCDCYCEMEHPIQNNPFVLNLGKGLSN